MASIMERMRMLVRSETSELREKFEDPERVINQTIADALVSYARLKEEAEPITSTARQMREKLDALTNEGERWHAVARKALIAGNEADARLALSREQDAKERIAAQRKLYEQAREVADAFTKRLTELEDTIAQLQAKSKLIKAKETTARATELVGKVSAESPSNGGTAAWILQQKENEADWHLAEAEGRVEAQRELESDPFEELMNQTVADSEVDAALAALREQLKSED